MKARYYRNTQYDCEFICEDKTELSEQHPFLVHQIEKFQQHYQSLGCKAMLAPLGNKPYKFPNLAYSQMGQVITGITTVLEEKLIN